MSNARIDFTYRSLFGWSHLFASPYIFGWLAFRSGISKQSHSLQNSSGMHFLGLVWQISKYLSLHLHDILTAGRYHLGINEIICWCFLWCILETLEQLWKYITVEDDVLHFGNKVEAYPGWTIKSKRFLSSKLRNICIICLTWATGAQVVI